MINIFDGFKNFWGSQLVLIPDNFVIAQNAATLGGKHAHITWEGDAGNSQARNNFNERLTFENNSLTDSNNPQGNQFNGYSNVTGTTSGVDIDQYPIGSLLTPGKTSVQTTYSTGQDSVFLTAEIISVPNEPVAELSIQQSGPSRFIRDASNTINYTVTNNGPNTAPPNTQVVIPLSSDLTLANFVGNQWNCSATSSAVTCSYNAAITKNSSANNLSVSLYAAPNTANTVNLSATVSGILFDNILSNNTRSQTYNVISASLANSTKAVTDINGGNVQPGDILRYQIDLKESNGVSVSGISVVDHLPENISSFDVVSVPSGANINVLAAPNGDNGNGRITVNNISIAANAIASIVIDATIDAQASNDSVIINTATISGLAADVEVQSPAIYISQTANPASGNKPLYLRQSSTLSRIQPTSSAFNSITDLGSINYVIEPEFQQEFRFSSSSVSVYLFLQNDYLSGSWGHNVRVSLLHNNTVIGEQQQQITVPSRAVDGDNVALFEFPITLTSMPTINKGDTLTVRIFNDSDYAVDSLRIYSIDPNESTQDVESPFSLVSLPAATVINVDQITVTKTQSNSTNDSAENTEQPIHVSPQDTLSIEAVISDPFGSFDITSANIVIIDSNNTRLIDQQAMTVLADSGAATKTYQFSYKLADDAELGDWKIIITGFEGTENEISHSSELMVKVSEPLPNIILEKSVSVYADPIHGKNTANNFSKALPGAILTYTLSAKNSGPGVAQADSIIISDALPSNTFMVVNDFDDVDNQGPVLSLSSNTNSGLNYNFIALNSSNDDLEFSNDNGASFNYSPIADSNGIDRAITHFRIKPKGTFLAPAVGQTATQFTVRFRVQLE